MAKNRFKPLAESVTLIEDTPVPVCEWCDLSYTEIKRYRSDIQMARVLPLTPDRTIKVDSRVSTLWLIAPFIKTVKPGEVISMTAFTIYPDDF